MMIDREPPRLEDMARRLKQRLAAEGIRTDAVLVTPSPRLPAPESRARSERALRTCHLPREETPVIVWRVNSAYVPQLSAAIEDDPNLTDGARRCARKLAEYSPPQGPHPARPTSPSPG